MRRLWLFLSVAAGLMAAAPTRAQVLEFEALTGWQEDDHAAAFKPSSPPAT